MSKIDEDKGGDVLEGGSSKERSKVLALSHGGHACFALIATIGAAPGAFVLELAHVGGVVEVMAVVGLALGEHVQRVVGVGSVASRSREYPGLHTEKILTTVLMTETYFWMQEKVGKHNQET